MNSDHRFLLSSLASPRSVRLVSGLTLGLFLLTHFINLMMGLVSTHEMESARPLLTGLWSTPVGACFLYGALAIHVTLALRALYNRHTLAMSGREAAQLAFGLTFPFLLVAHVVGTAVVPLMSGHRIAFAQEVYALWVASPWTAGRQLLALAVGRLHACLGIWFWVRSKRWFSKAAPFGLAMALVVPLLAVLGFLEAGKEVTQLPPVPQVIAPWISARAGTIGLGLYMGLGSTIAFTFAARGARSWLNRRHRIRVKYPDGRVVAAPAGFSLLEVSRSAGIPHLSVCGGQGRCSTCRVRVLSHLGVQPPVDPLEQATLDKIKAEPNIRLACQLRPTHDISILPIFAADRHGTPLDSIAGRTVTATGVERNFAVLFCDLRGFTRQAERLLPYDTVFILNRYFQLVGTAVESSGGHLDKFIGDGALALFGLDAGPESPCRQALRAAALIARGMDDLNARLDAELKEPMRIAMGLHFGPAVVGEMGFGRATTLTAIGDGINVASRLEGIAKQHNVEAVASCALVNDACLSLQEKPQTAELAGRSLPIEIIAFDDIRLIEQRFLKHLREEA